MSKKIIRAGSIVMLGDVPCKVVKLAKGLLAISALAHDLYLTDGRTFARNAAAAQLVKANPVETEVEKAEGFTLVATDPKANDVSLETLKAFAAAYPRIRIVSSGMSVAAFKPHLPKRVIAPITTPETARLDNADKRVFPNKWQA